MVIVDFIKNFKTQEAHYALTFFRDNNQNEVDLIIELANKTIPVEIKSSETMNDKFFDTLLWFQEQTQKKNKGIIVYGGDKSQKRSKGEVISWKDITCIK